MSEVKWIKVTTNIFDDEKIRYIENMPNGDETIVIWFRLMCLAGKSNSNGLLMMTEQIYYTDELLASIFNRSIDAIRLALNIFQKLEMIEVIDSKINLVNWSKYQNIKGLEQIREENRLRTQKYRQKQLVTRNGDVTVTSRNALELEVEVEKELDKDLEKESSEEKGKTKSKRFVAPSLQEVRDYIYENHLDYVDPLEFVSYYASVDWFVGKKKMVSWQSACTGWNTRHSKTGPKKRVEPIPEYRDEVTTKQTPEEIEQLKERLKRMGVPYHEGI